MNCRTTCSRKYWTCLDTS